MNGVTFLMALRVAPRGPAARGIAFCFATRHCRAGLQTVASPVGDWLNRLVLIPSSRALGRAADVFEHILQ